MTVKLSKAEKKVVYDKKLYALLDEYSKVLVAAADNVGSNQLRNIRKGLRGDSIVLMGKNTLIRRCIKIHSEKTGNKNYLNLLVVRFPPLLPEKLWLCTRYLFLLAFMAFYLWFVLFVRLREIVGLIFTKGEISRNLVRRLPSTSPEVLDLTEEDLIEKFAAGLSRVYFTVFGHFLPDTLVANPHMFINAYMQLQLQQSTPSHRPRKLRSTSRIFAVAAPVLQQSLRKKRKRSLLRNPMTIWAFGLFD
ncbi:hypothetical protein B296_00022671 [Ensete ventricosum]|uniref:60S ribosomal protein L10P insertion domain-containing protein n=1 Tax=Ensete ventricosum TaxID=4639 RepID=A0A427A5S1_ENSVE|nr:hypothetical protein B296_00022671 [Ensete ventricosum]